MRAPGLTGVVVMVGLGCTKAPQVGPMPVEAPTVDVAADAEPEPAAAPVELDWLDLDLADSTWLSTGCAVTSGGSLRCWGADRAAGHHAHADDAVAVAASPMLVCWLDRGGAVSCVDDRRELRVIAGLEQVRELVVDDFRACALEADGELRCWEGEGVPAVVAGDVAQFDFTLHGGCVLDELGELGCWTQAVQHGQPRGRVEPIPAAPGVVDLDVIDDQYGDALWILDDRGRVRTFRWGNNRSEAWATVGVVERGVELAVARDHVCVRRSDGLVLCRGANSHGQLGDGTSVSRERFAPLDAREVLEVDVNRHRTCVRTAAEVACSGWDDAAEYEDIDDQALAQHTLPDLEARSLAAYMFTTCAVDQTDSLRCWGSDMFTPGASFGAALASQATVVAKDVGEVRGIWTHDGWWYYVDATGGEWVTHWVEDPSWHIERRDQPRDRNVAALGGELLVCAIRAGELACDRDPHRLVPVKGVSQVRAFSAASHLLLCAIDGRQRVMCGAHPDLYDEAELNMERVAKLDHAVALASSSNDACAAFEDGSVRCWSNERVDDWDDKTGHQTLRNIAGTAHDVGLREVTALVYYYGAFCSLDRAGAVSCWTVSTFDGERSGAPTPKLDAPVVELVAGRDHACARDVDGSVTCWGAESFAQLGRIPAGIALLPEPVF